MRSEAEHRPSPARLVREIAEDGSTLVRKEIQLAKQEIMESISAVLGGAATFGIAAVLGLMIVFFSGITAVAALSTVMDVWLAALVVTFIYVAGAGLAAMIGISMLKRRKRPLIPETTRTIKEDIGWAKRQLKR